MARTEEADEEMGGRIDEGRDGGREEGSRQGASEGGAAFAVAPPPLGLYVVGRGKGGRRGRRLRQIAKRCLYIKVKK